MDIQSFFTKERLTPSGFILLGLLTTLSILCLPVLIYFGVVHLPVIQTLCKVTNLLSVTQDLGNENFFIYLVDFNIGDQILSNVTMFQTRQNLTIGNFTNCKIIFINFKVFTISICHQLMFLKQIMDGHFGYTLHIFVSLYSCLLFSPFFSPIFQMELYTQNLKMKKKKIRFMNKNKHTIVVHH